MPAPLKKGRFFMVLNELYGLQIVCFLEPIKKENRLMQVSTRGLAFINLKEKSDR